MAYFLKHYFDPDFNHLDIKPKVGAGDRIDHFNRDYVHNLEGVISILRGENPRLVQEKLEAFRDQGHHSAALPHGTRRLPSSPHAGRGVCGQQALGAKQLRRKSHEKQPGGILLPPPGRASLVRRP